MDKILCEVKRSSIVHKSKIVVKMQLHDLGQGSYFSATFEEFEARGGIWRDSSGGAIFGDTEKEIVDRFPGIDRFLRWHLTSIEKGPMKYAESAIYWASFPKDHTQEDCIKHFKSTIVYGALESDFDFDPDVELALPEKNWTSDWFEEWIVLRAPLLMEEFDRDMVELFGDKYPVKQRYMGVPIWKS